MELIDISHPLKPGMIVWPGDTAFRRRINASLQDGDSMNLSDITMSVHAGSHADSPRHFHEEGETIEILPLDAFWGPARLLRIENMDTIDRGALERAGADGSVRLLIDTGTCASADSFPEEVPVLSDDAVVWLSDRGVRLVGLDVPSVDRVHSADLPVHNLLWRHGILTLENLRLAGVPEGDYELSALPLCIEGADGAPVRAALRPLVAR